MSDSILISTKKSVNVSKEDTAFDSEIIMHINSTFTTLNDLGIGPEDGFVIEDETDMWSTYLSGNKLLERVKSYMYLKVRMLFDPPTTSYHLNAMEKMIQEMEVRISIRREDVDWVNPNPEPSEV